MDGVIVDSGAAPGDPRPHPAPPAYEPRPAAATRLPAPEDSMYLSLPSDPARLALARRAVRTEMTRQRCLPSQIAAAELVVTELVANVIRHTPAQSYELGVHRTGTTPGAITASVATTGTPPPPACVPAQPPAGDVPDGGWGLEIVDALAHRWGVASGVGRHTTWAVLAPTGAPVPRRRTPCPDAVPRPDPA
ncbi:MULTISPECIES: ATP-binding protein [Streptomyces]|uniref:ATP-binding protein n=1 Tax=Streptomyces TaxID=1883 RepID=UPI0022492C64|nr:ATP-binding protein [Streptomyces sp. JHD 1]MCX2968223.1 ATP-binding protein [Streptomyces sp. JHD 1]